MENTYRWDRRNLFHSSWEFSLTDTYVQQRNKKTQLKKGRSPHHHHPHPHPKGWRGSLAANELSPRA